VSAAKTDQVTRRDFLYVATGAVGAVGVAAAAWPFISQMSPSADALALSTIEVDLAPIVEGQIISVMWRGKPVFVRHRTAKEIAEAQATPLEDLKDPQTDQARVQKAEWLVLVGICTHLGCIPVGTAGARGAYDGWFCPCHGSVYDTSGRIRQGPAPQNLEVPAYRFASDTRIVVGEAPAAATAEGHSA
jgi:ubiquinol-cytochrome c reductase iron-sulfur subunit